MNPRLRRLQADYADVRTAFSGHPHVVVEPVGPERPPERYRITYRLKGLALEGEQPVAREIHHVDLALPAKYPVVQPYVTPAEGEPIFHPNIATYFCIADYWWPSTKLTDIIIKLGDMIQWKAAATNPLSPLDASAARWAVAHEGSEILPVGNVDLGIAVAQASGGGVVDVLNGSESATGPVGSPLGQDDTPSGTNKSVEHAEPASEEDFEVLVLNSASGREDGSDRS